MNKKRILLSVKCEKFMRDDDEGGWGKKSLLLYEKLIATSRYYWRQGWGKLFEFFDDKYKV